MSFFLPSENRHHFRKYRKALLAFFVAIGIMSGILAAKQSSNDLFVLLCSLSTHTSSFTALFVVSVTPILASCLAVYSGHQWCLYVISLFKAFSWSFCSYLILIAFGAAGWLVQILMMFSGSCMFIFLCWFSLRYISSSTTYLLQSGIVAVLLALFVCSIDHCVISPYVANLIAY